MILACQKFDATVAVEGVVFDIEIQMLDEVVTL